VGSKTFDGFRFSVYPNDHLPPHVHAFHAEVEVIPDLDFEKRSIRLARRRDRIRPADAKTSDVKRMRLAA
jgi:hypothetical protein